MPPSIPLPPSSLSGVSFTLSSDTQTIPVNQLHLGENQVPITNTNIINTLNAVPPGSSVNAYLNFSYANGLQVVGKTTSYPPRTTEKIISVTRGPIIRGSPTALVRFSTANGRNAVGDTSIVGILDGLSFMAGIYGQVVADPGNTILSSFFTATISFGGQTLPTIITSLSVKSSMYSTIYSTIYNVTL
jgi:hypothetical protein